MSFTTGNNIVENISVVECLASFIFYFVGVGSFSCLLLVSTEEAPLCHRCSQYYISISMWPRVNDILNASRYTLLWATAF